jgi:Transglycosylase SLT domain
MLAEATSTATRSEVLAALKQASAATGSDFSYLLCTAMRESSLRPQAKSNSSSACGLFQFVEQTWMGLVKQFGAKHGLASYANAIERSSDGRFQADNANDRHAILALRNDPHISALMAGEYANLTRSSLESSLGRNVSNGELYAAHFLGPEAACRLIRMNDTQPQSCAATAFPQAAEANHSVFYHSDGTAKSVRAVYEWALKQPVIAQPASETIPALRSTSDTPDKAAAPVTDYPDDWAAMQLWAATQSSSTSLLASPLPQSPFAATPAVLDLLGSLDASGKSVATRTGRE